MASSETLAREGNERLLKGLSKLFLSPSNADVTIFSGTSKLPAHLAILSIHTDYFQRNLTKTPARMSAFTPASSCACSAAGEDGDDTETDDGHDAPLGISGRPYVELHDYESAIVTRMLQWCYISTYPALWEDMDESNNHTQVPCLSENCRVLDAEGRYEARQLMLHLGVYGIAQHVGIRGLQIAAAAKFKARLKTGPFSTDASNNHYFGLSKSNSPWVDEVAHKVAEILLKSCSGWGPEWQFLFERGGEFAAQVVRRMVEMNKPLASAKDGEISDARLVVEMSKKVDEFDKRLRTLEESVCTFSLCHQCGRKVDFLGPCGTAKLEDDE
ncbi:hypothetical protein EX30DRAFT_375351 [Ascodesmis nigricans]|uniref:Uncharacterized protein n=1 Tax=Ascodesmis nigricans TaxID=341454 RepID=A0A4S2MN32_9PEZI|nr:hypothetical protein EX30DRAFT_375351 [Ascodesmis nigricans]